MGKGNTTTTDTSHTALPAYQDAYKQLLSELQGTTQSTVGNLQGEFGSSGYDLAKPYINSAQDYITQAGTPFSQDSLQPYIDPYTQQVVDATQGQFNLQNGQSQNQLLGSIAANGAFAGDRGAVLQSELSGQQQTAQAPVIAGLYNQGYNTALSQYNADKERELAAGYGEAGLGSETQGLALQGIMAPLEAEMGLAGSETGLGNAAGYNGTETQTTTQPLLSQIFGGLESGAGAIGSSGGFGSDGWLNSLFSSGAGAAASGASGASAIGLPFFLSRGGGVKTAGRGIVVPFPVHRTRRSGGGGIRRFADGGDNTDDDYAPGWSVTGNLAQAAQAAQAPAPAASVDADSQPFKNTYTPLQIPDHYAEEERRAPWMALLSAGAGTLATGNIGAGFQKGIESYETSHKGNIEQQEKAAELENEGDYRKVSLDKDVYEINQRAKQAAAELASTNAYRGAEVQNWGLERMQAAANAHREDVLNGLVPPDQIATPDGPASGSLAGHNLAANNPGNIKVPGSNNQFQSFPTMQHGIDAVGNQLALYQSRGLNTIQQMVGTYAPPSENNTPAYIADVAKRTGIAPNQPLTPAQLPAVRDAMITHEQGGVTPQQLLQNPPKPQGAFIPPKFLGDIMLGEVPDGQGGVKQVPIQQDKRNSTWVTADGRQPISPTKILPMSAANAGQGSRAEVYFNRVSSAGNEAATAAKNIMELPITTTRGVLGGRGQGTGLLDAVKEDLANSVTGQEAQDYNVMMAGVSRNMATIEASGLAPNGSLTHSMDSLVIKEGDTEQTKMRKMAEFRQIVEKGLEPSLSNPRIPAEQKKMIQGIITQMQQAIPFTQHDITQLSQSKNPQQTLSDTARQSGLGAQVKTVTTKAQFDALPKGATYRESDGKLYRKP